MYVLNLARSLYDTMGLR